MSLMTSIGHLEYRRILKVKISWKYKDETSLYMCENHMRFLYQKISEGLQFCPTSYSADGIVAYFLCFWNSWKLFINTII